MTTQRKLFAACVLLGAVAAGPRVSTQAPAARPAPANGELASIHVQGNVYMLVGAGGNIAVQTGDDGVLVVDTGLAQNAERVIAAIKKLSTSRSAGSSTRTSIPITPAATRRSPRPAARPAAGRPRSSRTRTCSPG